MSDTGPETSGLPPLPEALLAPLLQWTGEALRQLKAQDVPPAVRPLLGFDRRGFGSAAARTQLRKALESDEGFRALVFEALENRDEAKAALGDWDPARAVEIAEAAVQRDDLARLASALVLMRPEWWELGIGVARAVHERGLERRAADDDRRAFDTQVAKSEAGRRRAEQEVEALRAEVERLTGDLRDERASRRDREETVRAAADKASRRVEELHGELTRAREQADRAEERAHREAERAEGFEAQVRDARTEAARARAEASRLAEQMPVRTETAATGGIAGLSPEEIELLARAGEIAKRIAPSGTASESATLPAVPEALEDSVEVAERRTPVQDDADANDANDAPVLRRRVAVDLPPGVVGPSVEGVQGALRRGDPAVIIDGYNVSMLAWGDQAPDAQRQRLCAQLERLHLRTNRSITVVFDGADVEGVRPPRRPGVRVLFSARGQEADEVVVREARALPLTRPAIVVSSDRWVQQQAEEAGALAVPSQVFIEVLRK